MVIKYFDIHSNIKIKIQSSDGSKMDTALMHLREFESEALDENDIDIYVFDYSKRPNLERPTIISNYYYYSDNYLDVPDKNFCFNVVDSPFVIYCNTFVVPLNFFIELAFLKKGYTLIHSAAVQYNGKNYLFPAFGGIGKTTAVSAILNKDGKLFGDDMIIVNNETILCYPLDFSIYPYHLDILNIEDKEAKAKFKRNGILDRCISLLRRYDYRASRLLILILNSMKLPYINIPPKKIFGENCIATSGQIDEIYYLYRVGENKSQIEIEPIDANELAKICTNVLIQEWHGSMSILYTYSGLSTFSLDYLFHNIKCVLEDVFMHHKCYQIKIPINLDNLSYQNQLIFHLDNKRLEMGET